MPATNPFNPFGTTVNFFGRAIGNGGPVSPSLNELNTWRTSIGLNGELQNGWYWQLAYVGAKNESTNSTPAIVNGRIVIRTFDHVYCMGQSR